MTNRWELRERIQQSAEQRIGILEQIADDPQAKPQHRIAAIAVLLQAGVGTIYGSDSPQFPIQDQWPKQ